jgi:hypothetical protein
MGENTMTNARENDSNDITDVVRKNETRAVVPTASNVPAVIKENPTTLGLTISNYSAVQTDRTKVKGVIKGLEMALSGAVGQANQNLYKDTNALSLFVKGVRGKNKYQVTAALNRLIHRKSPLRTILECQYQEFVASKNALQDNLDHSVDKQNHVYDLMLTNADNRTDLTRDIDTLGKEIASLDETIGKYESDRRQYDESKGEDQEALATLDRELTESKRTRADKRAEMSSKLGERQTENEMHLLLTMYEKECEEVRPFLEGLVATAKGRERQLNEVIQIEAGRIETAERVIDVLVKYDNVRLMMAYANALMTKFNENIGQLTVYLQTQPILPEADVARRVISIQSLKVQREQQQYMLEQTPELEKLSIADCYSHLALEITATKDEIKDAKNNILLQYNPDKFTAGSPEQIEAERIVTKTIYAAHIAETFLDIAKHSKDPLKISGSPSSASRQLTGPMQNK